MCRSTCICRSVKYGLNYFNKELSRTWHDSWISTHLNAIPHCTIQVINAIFRCVQSFVVIDCEISIFYRFPSYMYCQYSSPHNTRHVLPAILWLPNFSMPTISMHMLNYTLLCFLSHVIQVCPLLVITFTAYKLALVRGRQCHPPCSHERWFAEQAVLLVNVVKVNNSISTINTCI